MQAALRVNGLILSVLAYRHDLYIYANMIIMFFASYGLSVTYQFSGARSK